MSTRFNLGVENEQDGTVNLSRETSFSGANGGREKNIFICSAYNEQDCQPYPVDPYSTENADHTNTDYLHELLPSLPPSVSPQNLPARLLFPASRPSQPLAPHIRAPGAQDSRTNHSACAQVATRPADLLLALTLALFGGGGISGCFTLLRISGCFTLPTSAPEPQTRTSSTLSHTLLFQFCCWAGVYNKRGTRKT